MNRQGLQKISDHYSSRFHSGYVKSKLRTDPLYPAVWAELTGSNIPLLDLGCGLGLLAFYLRHRGFTPPILGIDYDQKKILTAQEIATTHYPDTQFQHGDAREGIPDFHGSVTILDILQFFKADEQEQLLRNAARSVTIGGQLIIRSGLKDDSWRFRITHAGDLLARATLWMKAAPTCYPTQESICRVLESEGLQGNVTPLWGKTPFNNYLIAYRRPASPVE
ncbi:MAG: 2-polyprenyl-3-methyl-5-hydroxy-6-metoxy-1,4-benzoquinol methylase [Verrucomicrobiales bacterium]|jgi:2-polyprenyl-3-methyl-5-hydroxy-6-metoxy-1,4-benzoquinol methylase